MTASVTVPAGGAVIAEFKVDVPGNYTLVDPMFAYRAGPNAPGWPKCPLPVAERTQRRIVLNFG